MNEMSSSNDKVKIIQGGVIAKITFKEKEQFDKMKSIYKEKTGIVEINDKEFVLADTLENPLRLVLDENIKDIEIEFAKSVITTV